MKTAMAADSKQERQRAGAGGELDPAALAALPLPPCPGVVGMIETLRRMRNDSLSFITRMSRDYGPVSRLPLGTETLIFLSDPDLIGEVLQKRAESFHKDPVTRKLEESLGRGLLTSENPVWRAHRKAIAPLFKRSHLEAWAAEMVQGSEAMVDAWQLPAAAAAGAAAAAPTQEVDVASTSLRLTLGIVFRTVFGAEVGDVSAEVGEAIDEMMEQFELELRTWRRFVPKSWLRGGRRRVAHARAALDKVVYGLIAARRLRPLEDGDDLLGRLMLARDESGAALTDEELRDEAVTMFVAGHETTAIALAFACWHLGLQPDLQRRLREELHAALGDRPPGAADLERLPLLRATIQETLRVHPPAYVVGRTALHDMELGGFRIEAGNAVLMSQWAMHHDPRYFPDPDAFFPDRWLNGLEQRLPKFAYFPFGGGPQVCVGNHFALMELQLCLASIVRRVELGAPAAAGVRTSAAVTLRPAVPMPMQLRLCAPAGKVAAGEA